MFQISRASKFIRIINEIACYNSRISMNLCQTIVDDVCILILCSKNSGIVDYATKCLTSFASLSVDSREKLKRLTRALMLILCRESKLDEERKILKSRAIFILGKANYGRLCFLDFRDITTTHPSPTIRTWVFSNSGTCSDPCQC